MRISIKTMICLSVSLFMLSKNMFSYNIIAQEATSINSSIPINNNSNIVPLQSLINTHTKTTESIWINSKLSLEDVGIKDTKIKKEYIEYAREIITEKYPNLSLALVLAVIEAESSGNPNTTNSKTGCAGLMQIYKKYHLDRMKRLGITDLYNPYQNILIGCDILSEQVTKRNDLATALMCYNGSKDAIERGKNGNYTKYANKVLNRMKELELYYN